MLSSCMTGVSEQKMTFSANTLTFPAKTQQPIDYCNISASRHVSKWNRMTCHYSISALNSPAQFTPQWL